MIKDARLFKSGFENSNYYIKTDKGMYVIKVFEGAGVQQEHITFELQVMDVSFRAGIKTPRVLQNKEGCLASQLDGKYAMIMDYIEGENMDKKEVSDQIAYEIGKETGKMDTALAIFPNGDHTRQQYEWDLKNFLILEPKLTYLGPEFDHELLQSVFTVFRNMQPVFDKLPRGIIHNDVALHNILVKDGQLKGLIDFSDMAYSPYIQNIAVPMAQMFFCYNWAPAQAVLFVKGYQEYHALLREELALLYDLTCARYATLVIEFNYWDKTIGIDAQRSEAIADFYQFLLQFRAFGKEAFNQLLNL